MHIVNLQPLATERCYVVIVIPDMRLDAAGCDMKLLRSFRFD
jgi:hypothetical protein